MEELTIGQVAQQTGLETSAIRYYESVGLLDPPTRVNGRRRFNPDVLKRLELIQLLRGASFGIRELQLLFGGLDDDSPASTEWQALVAEKIGEMDRLIKQTQATREWLQDVLERECEGVYDCFVPAGE